MAKRLLVFGPPGVGKGTHARRLASDLGVPHISTGDILRRSFADGSALGARAAVYMNAGSLVPDEIVVSMLEQRLAAPDTARGFLLDGFPRSLSQADLFSRRLSGGPPRAAEGDAVLSLEASLPVLLERLSGRQTCAACGASFNRTSRPSRLAGRCDDCGGDLVTRSDDEPATIQRRLQAYHADTAPALGRLAERGWPVRPVDAVGEEMVVYARILATGSGNGWGNA